MLFWFATNWEMIHLLKEQCSIFFFRYRSFPQFNMTLILDCCLNCFHSLRETGFLLSWAMGQAR